MTKKQNKVVGRPKKEITASKLLQIRVEPEKHKAYKLAADKKGLNLSAWAKDLMDKASENK